MANEASAVLAPHTRRRLRARIRAGIGMYGLFLAGAGVLWFAGPSLVSWFTGSGGDTADGTRVAALVFAVLACGYCAIRVLLAERRLEALGSNIRSESGYFKVVSSFRRRASALPLLGSSRSTSATRSLAVTGSPCSAITRASNRRESANNSFRAGTRS